MIKVQLSTDAEDTDHVDAQPSLTPLIPTAGTDDPIEVAEQLQSPRQSLVEPLCNSTEGLGAKVDEFVDRLAAHEQTHQEIAKVLEREERKLTLGARGHLPRRYDVSSL